LFERCGEWPDAHPFAAECECGALERLSNEPAVPVDFDPALNEYHIRGNGIEVMIYHCPHCGGRVPKSRRDQLFMHITHAERERLRQIVKALKTVPDMLSMLGPPDRDDRTGLGVTGTEDGRADFYRTLTRSHLSSTAEVSATIYPDEDPHFTFLPKPVERDGH
jgi:hypothetical protein